MRKVELLPTWDCEAGCGPVVVLYARRDIVGDIRFIANSKTSQI